MKTLRLVLLSIISCVVFYSCTLNSGIIEEPDMYTVKIGIGGEALDVTYEGLTRSGSGNMYGIQVYSAPNNGAETTVWTPYANGLFDSDQNISLNLLKGYKYKFEAIMIVDGVDRLASHSNQYYTPFYLGSGGNSSSRSLDNSFDYQASIYFGAFKSGSTYLKNPNSIFKHPNIERYYGELSDYVPGRSSDDRIQIQLKRASFGAKFMVLGNLANDGQLEVQIEDAPKMVLDITNEDNVISDIFTFANVGAAYSDDVHCEKIKVTLNWHQVDGNIFPLGTHELNFKRNTTTVAKIMIDSDSSELGIGFKIEESEMGEMPEDENVLIDDGQIVM